MNFKDKTDSELISEFKDLVSQERQLQTKILHYLRIIENRKIHLGLGFPSLFAFLTEEIGYSEATAYRRIQAMRLIQEMPEVEGKLEKGVLSLSVASQFQGFLRKENQKRKLQQKPKLTPQEKSDLLTKIEGTSVKRCEEELIKINPDFSLPREKTKPIALDKTLIQFTANKALMEKINRLKSLTSHQNPEGKYEVLMEKLVEIALNKLDPTNREQRRSKRGKKDEQSNTKAPSAGPVRSPGSWGEQATNVNATDATSLSTMKVTRYISPILRDQIWVRDQGKCQHQDQKTGKQCGSNYMLELDHKFPFSLGGENSENNLRLVCRGHNLFRGGRF